MSAGATALVRSATEELMRAGVPSPESDAATLLATVLGVPRTSLVLAGQPSAAEQARFAALVRRRAAREPLQHLTGRAPFRRVELAVGPGVFVPRPETELLAGWAIDKASAVVAQGRPAVVVDLGTGSGAIALAVATEVSGARVHAVEQDPQAHAWACTNLEGSSVDLRLGDMAEAFAELAGTVDVVVANPPYIPLDAYESVAEEARLHDPPAALWSGPDGLDAIRVVERVAGRLLRAGGVVGVEHADAQGVAAPRVFSQRARWRDVRDHPDLNGRARYVTAQLAAAPGRLTG